jgi:hypothetical protein
MHLFDVTMSKPAVTHLDETGDDCQPGGDDCGVYEFGFFGIDPVPDEGMIDYKRGFVIAQKKKYNRKEIKE